MPSIFDSHTHIQFPVYDKNREEVVGRAKNIGVKMLCVGTQYSTSRAALKLAESYPDDIWAAVGFHPSHLSEPWFHDRKEQKEASPERFDMEQFQKLASHPRAVAIGECGLDYYRLSAGDPAAKERQKEIFVKQAELASEMKKPIMIHCRPSKSTDDAYRDMLRLIDDNRQIIADKILHFYAGSLTVTKKFVEAGFYFTFGGVITFSKDYDEVIKYIPLDRILLETDAPYVAPVPHRGAQNEPAYIVVTARRMAEVKGSDYETLASETFANALRIFKIAI